MQKFRVWGLGSCIHSRRHKGSDFVFLFGAGPSAIARRAAQVCFRLWCLRFWRCCFRLWWFCSVHSGVASVYGGGVAFIPGVVVGSVHGSGGASVSGSIASRFSEIALSFILAVLLFMQAALPFLLVALPFMSTLLPFAAALHPFAAAKLRHLSPLALQKSAFRAPRNGTRGRSVATSAMVSTLLCDVRYRDSVSCCLPSHVRY